jgi:hypothetical protein
MVAQDCGPSLAHCSGLGTGLYDRPIFFITLLLETVVLLVLEAVLVTRAPVPYVEVDR